MNHIVIIRGACSRDIDIAGSSDYSASAFTTHQSISDCFPCTYIPYIINNDEIPTKEKIMKITPRIQRLYYSLKNKVYSVT
jgi:hypothetical protein